MRFKIDENLPAEIAEDLCALGHDAKTVFDQDMSGGTVNLTTTYVCWA